MKTLKLLFTFFLILVITSMFIPSVAQAQYDYWILVAYDEDGILDPRKSNTPTELTVIALIATATGIKASQNLNTVELSGMWAAIYEAPWKRVLEELTGMPEGSELENILESMCIPCGAPPILPDAFTSTEYLTEKIRLSVPGTAAARLTTNFKKLETVGLANGFGEYSASGDKALYTIFGAGVPILLLEGLPPFFDYDNQLVSEIKIIPLGN